MKERIALIIYSLLSIIVTVGTLLSVAFYNQYLIPAIIGNIFLDIFGLIMHRFNINTHRKELYDSMGRFWLYLALFIGAILSMLFIYPYYSYFGLGLAFALNVIPIGWHSFKVVKSKF